MHIHGSDPHSRQAHYRVGAFQYYDKDTLFLFGYGEYVGDEIPYTAAQGMSPTLSLGRIAIPLIYLDNGQHIFDCECYWDKEATVREIAARREVVSISIDNLRQQHGHSQHYLMIA